MDVDIYTRQARLVQDCSSKTARAGSRFLNREEQEHACDKVVERAHGVCPWHDGARRESGLMEERKGQAKDACAGQKGKWWEGHGPQKRC